MDTRAATSARQNAAGIIGGMFGLEDPSGANTPGLGFLAGPHLMTVNGRSALQLAIEHLRPRQTWFPSYFCDSMLTAVDENTTRLNFIPVDDHLRITSTRWLDELQAGDVVVLIEYFGFPVDEAWVERIHKRGAAVILDACQALLTDHSSTMADMIVYSPRKFVGVPDGGILELRRDFQPAARELVPPPADWLSLALRAATERRDFDRSGGNREWFTQFQAVESSQPVGDFAMSPVSRDLLGKLDYVEIARRRRENYTALLKSLPAWALIPELPDGVVPLGFPVRLSQRDRVRQALFAEQIYPPVHWPVAPRVAGKFADSERLAASQLTLPCDQRYGVADMERIARIVRQEAGP